MITTISSMTRVMYYQPWKDILNNLQGKSNEESLWLLRCSKYEKINLMFFKFRNVANYEYAKSA